MEHGADTLDLALWHLQTDVARLFQVVAERLGFSNQPAEWSAWTPAQLARHWIAQLSAERVAKLWQQYRQMRKHTTATPLPAPTRPPPRVHAERLPVRDLHALAQTIQARQGTKKT